MGSVSLRVDNKPVACPSFPFVDRSYRRGVGTHGQRVSIGSRLGSRAPRSYGLEFTNATAGQAREVRLTFQEAGTTKAVNWLPPEYDGGIVEVLFVENTLEIDQIAHDVYEIRFDLEEVVR